MVNHTEIDKVLGILSKQQGMTTMLGRMGEKYEPFKVLISTILSARAKDDLMQLHGIGTKVADCICLFALNKGEAFPVDVWVQRVMQELYLNNKKTKLKEIQKFGQKKWGKFAGYAQQYLYHWRRLHK